MLEEIGTMKGAMLKSIKVVQKDVLDRGEMEKADIKTQTDKTIELVKKNEFLGMHVSEKRVLLAMSDAVITEFDSTKELPSIDHVFKLFALFNRVRSHTPGPDVR